MRTTRDIDGHTITLEAGQRYIASRPFCNGRPGQVFPVAIRAQTPEGFDLLTEPDQFVDGLNYDEANAFLSAFNDGPTSHEGRVWK